MREVAVLTNELLAKFADETKIPFSENEMLSSHTTFRIGGPAEIFANPQNVEQAAAAVRFCKENGIKLFPLGKGSNLLVSDEGTGGVVLHFGHEMSKICLIDKETIFCEAGASLAKLCSFALENSLTGLEFAYGIPGSVGGAVFMNAGAYGGEIKDVILYAEHIDENGNAGRFEEKDLDMSYRHSVYSSKKYIITGAAFRLKKGEKSEIKAKMDELLSKRFDKQPMDKPSAGSTFKRPEGAFASALIDQCGLKGFTVGGAQVSEKHAGFVINKDGATCSDVLELIKQVQEKVKAETGFFLEPEVEILYR